MNLNQVTVPSLNLDISIPFYKKLGLKLIVSSSKNYARFECPDRDATFSIHKVETLPKGDGIYVYFECDDLDEHVNQLIKEGVEFEELPTDKIWLWREAKLKDPDNNQIILYYGGENRKDPPWKLKEL